ncbi:hypothetical protein ZIOFF_038625 [Zingiber officinale]|uniref:Uncharacterized protein n=2 Tax=Zingiber officinale TaxID=94328 RepID=A0A8J5FZQ6_ZINOF|nr:hypothetical protein ZIOFF_038625 [Zingiber officinale]
MGALAGGAAGAFTYVCLLPIDAIKTKLQTKDAAQIYSGALDAAIQTFAPTASLASTTASPPSSLDPPPPPQFTSVPAISSSPSSPKIPAFPPLFIPATAGAMRNIISSAIMVPKELITQRMQAGTVGRSWEVLRILEQDGILGLYAGYSATQLRNLPAGILSYSSFEYM